MKYKALSIEELQELEPEFVKYLAANTITAEDWVQMKKHEPLRTTEMINHFSELVFDSILNKMEFLELRTPKKIIVFKCGKEKMDSIVMETENKDADFLSTAYFKKVMKDPKGIKIYAVSKEYSLSRNEELFAMTEKGCFPTDGKLYETLNSSL